MPVSYNKKRKFKRIINIILNFICAFIIAFTLYLCAGIFIASDSRYQDKSGASDAQIFSYNAISPDKGELTAFGEKFIIDYNAIDAVNQKVKQTISINDNFTPSIFKLCGDIIVSTLTSAGEFFLKIPGVISYFYEKNN